MAIRLLAGLSVLAVVWHVLLQGASRFALLAVKHGNLPYDLDEGDILPDEPTALIVSDGLDPPRWTVAIPHNASFPLQRQDYQRICTQGESLRSSIIQDSRLAWIESRRYGRSYYSTDRTFLDVADAEAVGVLPAFESQATPDVCERSLTFSMDTDDAGFGKTLILLWMSYGLAKKEGRAFFIDDTRWPYGKYSSFFAPPPTQGCAPPLRHHILPCPRHARHLVVSAATIDWTYGSDFDAEFLLHRKSGSEKQQRIFELMRTGYEDLFRLVEEDASYARDQADSMKDEAASHHGSVVGMHIRRGDLHPYEYQFSRDYLPLERYAKGAHTLFRQLQDSSMGRHASDFSEVVEYVHSPLLFASDDPDVFESPDLIQSAAPFSLHKAQERIQLATKAALDKASPVESLREPGSAYVKHVDENSGWEGGFYTGLFYSLGRQKMSAGGETSERLHHASHHGSTDVDVIPEEILRMRELVGRAYLIDLAVLGQSEGIVCAVSSASCRILAVMLGWDAVRESRWLNVDDGRAWSWDGRR